MPIALRYFVTVRRATVRPCSASLGHELIVAQRMLLVFRIDNLLKLQTNSIPSDFFTVGTGGATAEESLQGENASRRLDPFFIDRTTHRGHVNADLIGNLLHFQRFDGLGAFVQKFFLMIPRWPGATLVSVARRCWIESISHWAEFTFRLIYSRVSSLVPASCKSLR